MPSLNDPRLDALVSLGNWLRSQDYRFVTVTPATHERVNTRPENRMARDLAGIFGWSRTFTAQCLPADWLALLAGHDLIHREAEGWRSRVRYSSLGDELLVHSAFPTLAADAVFFGPDTYRFDRLIRSHLAALDPTGIRRAADIGCGAGPGAIRIALACPDAEVHGLDINPAALDLARVNAALAGVDNLTLARSDLLCQAPGRFDLIVANPPYLLDASERAYRHGGGSLGAGLSLAIVDAALERLEPGGSLLLYTGVAMVDGADPFLARVRERLAQRARGWDWEYQELDPDVFAEELESPAYREAERIAVVGLRVSRRA
ncbi:methyltransferase [Pseudomonas paraeruginosa]|uniref:methyltransferase n=1 Tax=Pseudomonas paraeruginosa TaxID=2994495 RepID=UPI0024DE30B1|nr:methyltransferase [Pseudomonas paraeruginosa]MDK2352894.1 methyltransferase [Pseudomonas paraeruginosa]